MSITGEELGGTESWHRIDPLRYWGRKQGIHGTVQRAFDSVLYGTSADEIPSPASSREAFLFVVNHVVLLATACLIQLPVGVKATTYY